LPTPPGRDSGNFALLDIIKALQFIRRDIAKFGGNPSNVTLVGQSAGAINVYALLTTPATVQARPRLFHRAAPLSGGISLASNLPPGSIPTLNPASFYALQGNRLLYEQVIADGLAPDLAGAVAWVAGQTAEQVAAYLRSKTPATLLFTLLTRLAALGLAGSGPIPDGTMLPTDPIGAIAAGNYLRVPVLIGNTRDEGKLFPTFLPLVGGPSGRLVTDKQLFDIQFAYQPDAPPQIAIEQWIPGVYLPAATPVTGFTAKTERLDEIFLGVAAKNALDTLKSQQNEVWFYRFDWDEEPAAVQRDLRCGACLRPAVPVRQLRPVVVCQRCQFQRQRAGPAGVVAGDDQQPGCLRAARRSERAAGAGRDLARLAGHTDLRRHAGGQGHLGAMICGARPAW
jgi:para-nitrobenzyl esterase